MLLLGCLLLAVIPSQAQGLKLFGWNLAPQQANKDVATAAAAAAKPADTASVSIAAASKPQGIVAPNPVAVSGLVAKPPAPAQGSLPAAIQKLSPLLKVGHSL